MQALDFLAGWKSNLYTSEEFIDIGRIASIGNNRKPVHYAKKAVGSNPVEQQKMFSRHFVIEDELVSHISRKSIDMLKANYWGLEQAIAGTALYVMGPDYDLEDIKDVAMEDIRSVLRKIDKSGEEFVFRPLLLDHLKRCWSS
ncbi:Eukaryotic translation initiation factor 5B [Camellia lanceoleosa]|uniref:Eukaryotic translation initiation factor 5B n=1 Tax=Camellia lanceoleosa TaxID=1840588 RepID=A0ACC0GQY5_9ERIC|nr:Eukaryotic translation initiation factor 5B [Camellia lanceoleosa]